MCSNVSPDRLTPEQEFSGSLQSIARALRPVYCANSAEGAAVALEFFDQDEWGAQIHCDCPKLAAQLGSGDSFLRLSCRGAQDHLHHQCHRVAERVRTQSGANKGHFPNDQVATKLIWLAVRNLAENWKNPPISWHAAKVGDPV